MSAHSWNLQKAVYDALRADAGLIALAGDGGSPERARVFDEVPPGSSFPYVTIGEDTAVPDDDKDTDREELTLTVHAWSRQAGRKECKQIAAAIKAALHDATLTVTGGTVVFIYFDFAETFLDEDGKTRHGVIRFRALVEG